MAQDYLGYQYFKSYGLKVIRTRGFNHTGPRRGQVFVTSNFCSQVAAIELGLRDPTWGADLQVFLDDLARRTA